MVENHFVHDRKWLKTVSCIKGFVPRIVHEFYANMSEDIETKRHPCYYKVYVRGHVYDFSCRFINDLFQAPSFDFDDSNKDYDDDDEVATKLRDTENLGSKDTND